VGRSPARALGQAPNQRAPHEAPEADPVLADLRNALEHLDEAELDEATATPSENPARTKSLRKLPGAQLLIGTGGNPRQLFDLIDSDEIERRALDVVTTADRLDQQAEDYLDDLLVSSECPPRDRADGEEEA
jgi:hypothetical protein